MFVLISEKPRFFTGFFIPWKFIGLLFNFDRHNVIFIQ